MCPQVAALRLEKQKWQLLTAERDAHQSRTGDLEAEVARLRVCRRSRFRRRLPSTCDVASHVCKSSLSLRYGCIRPTVVELL